MEESDQSASQTPEAAQEGPTSSEAQPAEGQHPPAADPPASGGNKGPIIKRLPTKPLATNRIAFPRQFDAVRAFVIASHNGQPVSLGEVAPHAQLTVSTISTITTFLVAAGLLTKSEGNKFTPTPASVEYERGFHWNKETAAYALGPALEAAWFGQAIVNRLKMRGTISAQEALEVLASESQATPEYRPQLKVTLDWLIATGVVDKDGDTLKIARKTHARQPTRGTPTPAKPEGEKAGEVAPTDGQRSQGDEAGAITLNVAIKIDVKELTAMTPDRISAFFQGLAAVVAAKRGMEGE